MSRVQGPTPMAVNNLTNIPAPTSLSQQQQQRPSTSTHDDNSTIVGLHYRIGKKIGEGSFGVLFEGINMINGTPVAIKFEPRKTEAPQLKDCLLYTSRCV